VSGNAFIFHISAQMNTARTSCMQIYLGSRRCLLRVTRDGTGSSVSVCPPLRTVSCCTAYSCSRSGPLLTRCTVDYRSSLFFRKPAGTRLGITLTSCIKFRFFHTLSKRFIWSRDNLVQHCDLWWRSIRRWWWWITTRVLQAVTCAHCSWLCAVIRTNLCQNTISQNFRMHKTDVQNYLTLNVKTFWQVRINISICKAMTRGMVT
jgi:hypothetical protein